MQRASVPAGSDLCQGQEALRLSWPFISQWHRGKQWLTFPLQSSHRKEFNLIRQNAATSQSSHYTLQREFRSFFLYCSSITHNSNLCNIYTPFSSGQRRMLMESSRHACNRLQAMLGAGDKARGSAGGSASPRNLQGLFVLQKACSTF